MKLSAFFLTVNIAATLPLALQGSAQAANDTANSAEWLKQNITALSSTTDKTSAPKTPLIRRKLSATGTNAVAQANVINGVKLRAFVPGRKLASKRDLQVALQSQQPTMATEAVSSLNGKVSETYRTAPLPSLQNNISPYAQPNYTQGSAYLNTTSAPRVMPGELQTVARQVKQQIKRNLPIAAQQQLRQIKQNLTAPTTAVSPETIPADANGAPATWMANTQNLQLVAPGAKTPEEQAQMSKMIQNIDTSVFEQNGQGGLNSQPAQTGTAGPPPFPLNLLPEQSLKQLLGAKGAPPAGATAAVMPAPRSKKISAPPQYFGSWHGSSPAAQSKATASASHLAPGGFQTHMHSKGFAMVAPHQTKSKATTVALKTPAKPLIAQARKPELKISLYAPYNSHI